MGEDAAQRMLGPDGWKPTGTEAKAIGLAQWVSPHDSFLDEAQRLAALGAQPGALGRGVQGAERGLGAQRVQPRPQRLEDRVG